MSFLTATKDYAEILHQLVEHDPNLGLWASDGSIKAYNDLGNLLTYFVINTGSFLNFSWLKNLWSWPIIVPDISAAMISEVSIFGSGLFSKFDLNLSFSNTLTPLNTAVLENKVGDLNLSTIEWIPYGGKDNNQTFAIGPVAIFTVFGERFITGFLNSFFLFLPTSTSHFITLRRFIFQGTLSGFIAGLGTIAGNLFWLTSIIFGWRFFVIPWLSFDLLRYFLGFILIIRYFYDSFHETSGPSGSGLRQPTGYGLTDAYSPTEKTKDMSKTGSGAKGKTLPLGTKNLRNTGPESHKKMFWLNFVLALTEQSTIYPFIGNISFRPTATALEGFYANTYTEFIGTHFFYLFGIFVGSFSLLKFTYWLFEEPFYRLYLWVLATWPRDFYAQTAKRLKFVFLYITMVFAVCSIPYYGLDYIIMKPLGFVNNDELLTHKVFLESSFINTAPSDYNTRQNRFRHSSRERWNRRLKNFRSLDTVLYDGLGTTGSTYDLLTLEDTNYGFDRFWYKRKKRSHEIRYRLIPAPLVGMLKKSLLSKRLKNERVIRLEFFDLLYQYYYHPSFHDSSRKIKTPSGSLPVGQRPEHKALRYPYAYADPDATHEDKRLHQGQEPLDSSAFNIFSGASSSSQSKREKVFGWREARQNETNGFSNGLKNIKQISALRKFVRKISNRVSTLNNESSLLQNLPVERIVANELQKPIYSKRWKRSSLSVMYGMGKVRGPLKDSPDPADKAGVKHDDPKPTQTLRGGTPVWSDGLSPMTSRLADAYAPHLPSDKHKPPNNQALRQPEISKPNPALNSKEAPNDSPTLQRFFKNILVKSLKTNSELNKTFNQSRFRKQLSKNDLQILRYRNVLSSYSPLTMHKTEQVLSVGSSTLYPTGQRSIKEEAPKLYSIFNKTQAVLHPIKQTIQKETAFRHKFQYYGYGVKLFRKIEINNPAPFFKTFLKRFFIIINLHDVGNERSVRIKKTRRLGPKIPKVAYSVPNFSRSSRGLLALGPDADLARPVAPGAEYKDMPPTKVGFGEGKVWGNFKELGLIPDADPSDKHKGSTQTSPTLTQRQDGQRQQGQSTKPYADLYAYADPTDEHVHQDKHENQQPSPYPTLRATGLADEHEQIVRPTHLFSLQSKKAERCRRIIHKDVMLHGYYAPLNRFLIEKDIDFFINRQPKANFLTKKEERLLHLRRFLLAEHYNTLRWYNYANKNMFELNKSLSGKVPFSSSLREKEEEEKTRDPSLASVPGFGQPILEDYKMIEFNSLTQQINEPKSFANKFYNQQFQGTFKKIRHLFAMTPNQGEQPILKFDQILYNETANSIFLPSGMSSSSPFSSSLGEKGEKEKSATPQDKKLHETSITKNLFQHEELNPNAFKNISTSLSETFALVNSETKQESININTPQKQEIVSESRLLSPFSPALMRSIGREEEKRRPGAFLTDDLFSQDLTLQGLNQTKDTNNSLILTSTDQADFGILTYQFLKKFAFNKKQMEFYEENSINNKSSLRESFLLVISKYEQKNKFKNKIKFFKKWFKNKQQSQGISIDLLSTGSFPNEVTLPTAVRKGLIAAINSQKKSPLLAIDPLSIPQGTLSLPAEQAYLRPPYGGSAVEGLPSDRTKPLSINGFFSTGEEEGQTNNKFLFVNKKPRYYRDWHKRKRTRIKRTANRRKLLRKKIIFADKRKKRLGSQFVNNPVERGYGPGVAGQLSSGLTPGQALSNSSLPEGQNQRAMSELLARNNPSGKGRTEGLDSVLSSGNAELTGLVEGVSSVYEANAKQAIPNNLIQKTNNLLIDWKKTNNEKRYSFSEKESTNGIVLETITPVSTKEIHFSDPYASPSAGVSSPVGAAFPDASLPRKGKEERQDKQDKNFIKNESYRIKFLKSFQPNKSTIYNETLRERFRRLHYLILGRRVLNAPNKENTRAFIDAPSAYLLPPRKGESADQSNVEIIGQMVGPLGNTLTSAFLGSKNANPNILAQSNLQANNNSIITKNFSGFGVSVGSATGAIYPEGSSGMSSSSPTGKRATPSEISRIEPDLSEFLNIFTENFTNLEKKSHKKRRTIHLTRGVPIRSAKTIRSRLLMKKKEAKQKIKVFKTYQKLLNSQTLPPGISRLDLTNAAISKIAELEKALYYNPSPTFPARDLNSAALPAGQANIMERSAASSSLASLVDPVGILPKPQGGIGGQGPQRTPGGPMGRGISPEINKGLSVTKSEERGSLFETPNSEFSVYSEKTRRQRSKTKRNKKLKQTRKLSRKRKRRSKKIRKNRRMFSTIKAKEKMLRKRVTETGKKIQSQRWILEQYLPTILASKEILTFSPKQNKTNSPLGPLTLPSPTQTQRQAGLKVQSTKLYADLYAYADPTDEHVHQDKHEDQQPLILPSRGETGNRDASKLEAVNAEGLYQSINKISLMVPINPIPFYAGWDDSLRKFVITNRLLSRREAGYQTQTEVTQNLSLEKTNSTLLELIPRPEKALFSSLSPQSGGQESYSSSSSGYSTGAIYPEGKLGSSGGHKPSQDPVGNKVEERALLKNAPTSSLLSPTIQFTHMPIQYLSIATNEFKTTFAPFAMDQAFSIGHLGHAPLGWRRFKFKGLRTFQNNRLSNFGMTESFTKSGISNFKLLSRSKPSFFGNLKERPYAYADPDADAQYEDKHKHQGKDRNRIPQNWLHTQTERRLKTQLTRQRLSKYLMMKEVFNWEKQSPRDIPHFSGRLVQEYLPMSYPYIANRRFSARETDSRYLDLETNIFKTKGLKTNVQEYLNRGARDTESSSLFSSSLREKGEKGKRATGLVSGLLFSEGEEPVLRTRSQAQQDQPSSGLGAILKGAPERKQKADAYPDAQATPAQRAFGFGGASLGSGTALSILQDFTFRRRPFPTRYYRIRSSLKTLRAFPRRVKFLNNVLSWRPLAEYKNINSPEKNKLYLLNLEDWMNRRNASFELDGSDAQNESFRQKDKTSSFISEREKSSGDSRLTDQVKSQMAGFGYDTGAKDLDKPDNFFEKGQSNEGRDYSLSKNDRIRPFSNPSVISGQKSTLEEQGRDKSSILNQSQTERIQRRASRLVKRLRYYVYVPKRKFSQKNMLHIPDIGGITWPGDYLRVAPIQLPFLLPYQLKDPDNLKVNQNPSSLVGSSFNKDPYISQGNSVSINKVKYEKRKSPTDEVSLNNLNLISMRQHHRKYLIEKHNLKVLKTKLKKALRSDRLNQTIFAFKQIQND
uniref:Hypothetical chloroplast RF1 n=1 Tax=Staurocarteria crucifera TaxID=47781 RepID=A0A0S2ICP5_9CHLO|nr:hypothetical chloroplast RF1 [Carteria crucifera]